MAKKKTTQEKPINGEDLRAFRKNFLKFSLADTSRLLRIPVRTLEDYEAGRRRVPGVVGVAVYLLAEKQERVTRKILDELSREIDRQFPGGIPSELVPEEAD
jgi:DNA-binding transcriptional regulator YiaG